MAIVNSRAAIEPKTGKAAIFVNETIHSLIRKLFANNEQGFAYDPNDLTTLYQDAAGTVPVTGVGQAVGLIKDKSGRGNHAYQTTSASRPLLQRNATIGVYYLEFDGSDDFLVTNSIDFTATDKASLFAGVRKLSDTAQIITELSETYNVNNGSFCFIAGNDVGGIGYISIGRGSATVDVSQFARSFTYIAPDTAVLSVKHDISNSLSSIRRNGVSGMDGLGYKGSGNFGNYPLYIGRRGGTSFPFNGHIYSLIGVGRLTTDAETAVIEKELAKRTGVTLSV
ncbi:MULTISPECIES: hypothetical protein [Acinetobacter]|uniref:hypothetical protein n=1 Tax=Acinetobacter TaxID=469 RepID=UPI0015B753F4|nr:MULTISPECIES: hypothetical protein [Acinetobacter]MBT0886278.1 hypothetical protein [Acinetobacter towneri]NWJ91685.1 hypothetical protein [Acinetobacter sp. Swhac1]